MTDTFFDMPVVVTPCMMEFDRWARTHRNNRIAKKWRKRYGAVSRCGSLKRGEMYRVGGCFMACRCILAKIKEQVK